MKTIAFPRAALLGLATLASLPIAACSDTGYGGDRPGYASDRDGYYGRHHRRWRQGDEYVLSRNDTVYRDENDNYYCQKPDGTRGAIIGGVAGGVLGNVIAPRGSKTLGTIIGAAGGAIAGTAIDKGEVRCR
ncbi:glycine zipper 2TM domain-containing protein [Sphingobium nicotianae]|uniref:17 kDa surface antigen n=1 Tax=Sphingobium nicotianae TaxID=2782607 RepID=A0A9X1D9P5_9SPHN|nr:glycine zipper 2TM domain-containing protein [Sphingobium nicotianae]MBT2185946.1 glycine zipper 2TM domain-containing protein [Sphingobium nicotianae]